jgi:Tol biopolymer transport system component
VSFVAIEPLPPFPIQAAVELCHEAGAIARAVAGAAAAAVVVALAGCGGGDGARPDLRPPHLGRTFASHAAAPAPRVDAQIAYTSGLADPAHGTTIRLVDLVAGHDREIARLRGAQGNSGFSAPAWSPDGRRLLMTSSQTHRRRGATGRHYDEYEIASWVVGVDGRGLRRLPGSRYVSATPGARGEPGWTPDGTAAIVRGSRGEALLAVDRRGGSVATGVASGPYSPDGRRMLVESLGSIWVATLPSRRMRRAIADGGQSAWSPDGRQIVFVSSRDRNGDVGQGSDEPPAEGAAGEVYVADASGRRQRRVTHTTADEYVPLWSPDGRLILFDATGAGGEILSDDTAALQVIRPDGRCLTALPAPTSVDLVPGGGYAWRPGSDTRRVRLRCP